jgi:hypothetical protein
MESKYPIPPYKHTEKGLSIVDKTTKSTKCCDACECGNSEEEKFNKLMETQSSFEE